MRNLILFFVKYHAILLFIFFESICLSLVVQNNSDQREIYLNSSSIVSGTVYDTRESISQYWALPDKVNRLHEENTALHSKIEALESKLKLYEQKDSSRIKPPLITPNVEYKFIPASIINNSTTASDNFFTLNKGESDGLEKHWGVIGNKGLAGIVRGTSANYAVAMSLLHRNIRISAQIKRTNFHGTLQWDSEDPNVMQLKAIPKHTTVQQGDTIMTTGFSSIFPRGILVGVVSDFEKDKGSNFYNIKVKLAEDLHQLRNVYVIKPQQKKEQLKLEAAVKDE